MREHPVEHRNVAEHRDLALDLVLRLLADAGEHDGLPVLHGDRGVRLATVDDRVAADAHRARVVHVREQHLDLHVDVAVLGDARPHVQADAHRDLVERRVHAAARVQVAEARALEGHVLALEELRLLVVAREDAGLLQDAHRGLFREGLQDHLGTRGKGQVRGGEVRCEDVGLGAGELRIHHDGIVAVGQAQVLAPLDAQLEVITQLHLGQHHGDHHLATGLVEVLHDLGQAVLDLRRCQDQERVLPGIRHHAALADQGADLGLVLARGAARLPGELDAAGIAACAGLVRVAAGERVRVGGAVLPAARHVEVDARQAFLGLADGCRRAGLGQERVEDFRKLHRARMLQRDVPRHACLERLVDLRDQHVQPLEVVRGLADHDQAVGVRVRLDAEDVGDGHIRARLAATAAADPLHALDAGAPAACAAARGASRAATAAAFQQRLQHGLHLERVGVLQVVETEDAVVSRGRRSVEHRDQRLDLVHDRRLGADRQAVGGGERGHHQLLAGADLDRAAAARRIRRAAAVVLLALRLAATLARRGCAARGRTRREQVRDDAGDRLCVLVLQADRLGAHVHVRLLVEQVDQVLHALGKGDVAFQDDLVGVVVHLQRGVARQRVAEALVHLRGLGVLDAEHLDDDVAVLRQVRDVHVRAEHLGRLQRVELGEVVDEDHVLRLDHAQAVQAERLEDQVERLALGHLAVADDGDLDGRERRLLRDHHLAGPQRDGVDERLDLLVTELEPDELVARVRLASLGRSLVGRLRGLLGGKLHGLVHGAAAVCSRCCGRILERCDGGGSRGVREHRNEEGEGRGLAGLHLGSPRRVAGVSRGSRRAGRISPSSAPDGAMGAICCLRGNAGARA